MFHARSRQLAGATREAAEWENRLFDRLMDLLDGFKEVRLNRRAATICIDDIVEVSRTAANIKIRTQSETFKRMVFLAERDLCAARRHRIRVPDPERHARRQPRSPRRRRP